MNLQPLSWEASWRSIFGFSAAVPSWVVAAICLFLVYAFVIFPSYAAVSYLNRKLGADFQARIGPNRAGPRGIFQPLADFLKLVQKESIGKMPWRESFWFGVYTMALYSTVAVLPLGSIALLVDTDMSAFIPFWAGLVLSLGTMLLGISQGSVSGWFGGVRVAAQSMAGAFPAFVALLCAGIRAGGFRWSTLAQSQGFSPLHWTALADPFQLIAFLVFLTSGLVMLGISPMDAGVSNSDLHGGVSAHLYGRRLGLFLLGRFYGSFMWAVLSSVLFLGAWILPENLTAELREANSLLLLQILEMSWLLLKAITLLLVIVWVSRLNPRSRVDQNTDFAWKVLSPFALAALIGVTLWSGWEALR